MTRLEAIAILDGFKYNPLFNEQHFEAFDLAVSALSEDKKEQSIAIKFCHEHKLLMIPVDAYHRMNVGYYAYLNNMTYEEAEKAILENDYLKGASE